MESERGQTRSEDSAERAREISKREQTKLPFASEGLETLRDCNC